MKVSPFLGPVSIFAAVLFRHRPFNESTYRFRPPAGAKVRKTSLSMPLQLWQSLKARLWFIIGCATLPLLSWMTWSYWAQYQEQVRLSASRVQQVLDEAKRFEQVALDQVRVVLGIMSRANEMQGVNQEACNGLTHRLLQSNTYLANMGAVQANGLVFCSAVPASSAVDVNHRAWFQEAMMLSGQSLTQGEFVIGRISGKPGIVFGYPMWRDQGAWGGALFASVSMDLFKPVVGSIPDEEGWRIQILTRDGRVLLSDPPVESGLEQVAETSAAPLADVLAMLENGAAVRELRDSQGKVRLYGVAPMAIASDQLIITVMAPLHLTATRLQTVLAWQVAGLFLLLVLSAAFARWQVYGLIENWTVRLGQVLHQIGQGRLDASMRPTSSIRELAQVEAGLLSMTEDLRQSRFENQRLLLAIEQSPVSVVITDPDGSIEYVNQRFVSISGYEKSEVLGKNPRILNHGLTPKAVYERLWSALARGQAWSGEFLNTRKDGSTYTELATIAPVHDEQGKVVHYVAVKEDITQLRAAQSRLDHLVNYDALTDLPNRRLLRDRIQQATLAAERSRQWGMVLLLDLDRFKLLNDTYGHDVGDRLLQATAERLSHLVREEDTVARHGDDEFAVLVEGLGLDETVASEKAQRIAQKVQEQLSQPWDMPPNLTDYRTALTIGITLFQGARTGVEDLMQQAETALIRGKEMGGATTVFHNPDVQTALRQRSDLEQAMRRAIQEEAFSVYYQPQVDKNGRTVGAEALVRWRKPDGSIESPANFIPLAESTGLIVPLGEWVLKTGLRQLRHWSHAPQTQGLELSINISAAQFKRPDFVNIIQEGLSQEQVLPQRLILELTESIVLDDVDFVIERMEALRQIGVRFSLDDFGTGYSSLAYLKRLPLQQVKIDQSFVGDMLVNTGSQAIVKAVLAMAHAMDLDVVAEGVETAAQRDFLIHNGCTLLQGYLFGRPVPIEDFQLSS